MQIQQVLFLTAGGLFVLAGGVSVYDLLVRKPDVVVVYQPPRGGAGIQSPVRIVGGSLRTAASGNWDLCGGSTAAATCLVSRNPVDTTALATDADLPMGGPEEPEAWVGAAGLSWTVTVTSHSNKGITICPTAKSAFPPTCAPSASNNSYVLVQITGSGPYLVRDAPDTKMDSPYYRYYDRTATDTNGYEHIQTIVIGKVDGYTNNSPFPKYTYACTDGRCNVDIGR
jgi:hypothetical protein